MTAATQPGSVGVVQTRTLALPDPLPLDCGRALRDVRIAYETYGTLSPEGDNVVLVCHALSGDAHAAGWSADAAPTALDGIGADERGVRPKGGLGWWDGMIGPGKPFDTDRYFVVSTNLLGGCRGSTGPGSTNPETGRPYGSDFPVLTIADMVRAQRAFLAELGIDRVLCATGASLGGMQALQWTIDYPDAVDLCLGIATTAHLDARGVALNAVARNAIMADPDWQGGDYHGTGRAPARGLAVARQLGHITYLSRFAFAQKFGRRLQDRDDVSYTLDETDFAVESYLRYQGDRFVERFDANTYLVLSRALTYFDLERSYGSLEQAFDQARAAYTLLSFSSDWMYPPADSHELEHALRAAGREVEHVCVETTYGHDSFLLEEEAQAPHIAAALERALNRRRAHV
jgi:homoserine O-acetyltransferase